MGLRRVRFARESSAKNLYRFPYRCNRWRLEMWLSVLYITRREDFLSHFSDQLFDEPTLSTVQHKSTREKPRTVKFSREILNQSEILSLVFFVFTLCRPLQIKKTHSNINRTSGLFCFCGRRASRSTLEKYVLVKRLILPTSLLDTQTVWQNSNKQDFVHTIQLSRNLAQNAIRGREKVNVMKLIKWVILTIQKLICRVIQYK